MSKKTNVWMPLYIADYLADTTRLTTEQHGAYLLLIMDYWRNGALPDDDGALANITRLTMPQWKKHRPVLARLFQVEAAEWRHRRIDTELERATANVEQRSAAGKASAAKRKAEREAQQRHNENSTGVATDVDTEDQRDGQQNSKPSPSPSPTTTEGKPSFVVASRTHAREAVPGTTVPADFEPDQSHRGIAHNMGLNLPAERDKFVDHYTATGDVLADWPAKFRNWLRNGNKHGDSKFQAAPPRRAQAAGTALADKNAAAFSAAREMIFGSGDGSATERETQP